MAEAHSNLDGVGRNTLSQLLEPRHAKRRRGYVLEGRKVAPAKARGLMPRPCCRDDLTWRIKQQRDPFAIKGVPNDQECENQTTGDTVDQPIS